MKQNNSSSKGIPLRLQRLSDLFDRVRPWAIAILVLLGFLTPLFPAEYRYIPLTGLLGVIAHALQEVLSRIPTKAKVVDNISEAKPFIYDFLDRFQNRLSYRIRNFSGKKLIRKEDLIHIQWIGITMSQAWVTLEEVLNKLADKKLKNVKVEITLVSAQWLESNSINPEMTPKLADVMAENIERYLQDKKQDLGWEYGLYRYAHMPMIHGGLLCSQYLFLGLSQWDQKRLKAGFKSYEIHECALGSYAENRIEVFQQWFAFLSTEQVKWYAENSKQSSAALTPIPTDEK